MMCPELSIDDYDYCLPDERIAKYPLAERDASKLLLFRDGVISESVFSCLPDYLAADDLLVFNDTRVIRARIEMAKPTGARIELFCLEPHEPSDYQLAFTQTAVCDWKCLVGNGKKWKEGLLEKQVMVNGQAVLFSAERLFTASTCVVVRFRWNGGHDFGSLLEALGRTPIPPYLNRPSEAIDDLRYQTVYSRYDGSVAAPTAGLHFTPEVLARLTAKGVDLESVTLHVGAGTFRPVQHHDARQHEMHTETFSVTATLLRKIIATTGCITAVGTTSMRALESIYWTGVMLEHDNHFARQDSSLHLGQWDAYNLPQDVSLHDAISRLLHYMETTGQDSLHASTQIMITPGYRFRVCQRLVTNFHQPRSTLLLLVSALIGDRWKEVYRYAMEHGFRFLSYGDSSLLNL